MKSISHKYYKALESLGTEQNRKIYKRHGASDNLFGVSFANLKKLAKEFKRETGKSVDTNVIAFELWETKNTDAMTLAAIVMNPDKITLDEINKAAYDVTYQIVGDELSKIISKSPFAAQIIEAFTRSDKEFVKRIGFVALSHKVLSDNYQDIDIKTYINQIEEEIHISPNRAKEGMNNCLIALGSIDKFHAMAIKTAKAIGKVEIDHGKTSCKTYSAAGEIIRLKEYQLKKTGK